MKKLITLSLVVAGLLSLPAFTLFVGSPSHSAPSAEAEAAGTCYFYITQQAEDEFEEYEGEELKMLISNIITADCEVYKTNISLEYRDALRAKYPETYFYTSDPDVWGPYESRDEAAKEIRSRLGKLRSDGWRVIDFHFTYYGD